MNKQKYFLQIDLMKGLAIISVILLHTIPTLAQITHLPVVTTTVTTQSASNFPISQLYKIILAFTISQAVPLFFLIMGRNSGYSFYRKNYNSLKEIYSKKYFKSKFVRLFFPFIIIFITSLFLAILLKKNIYLGLYSIIGYLPISGPGNYFISIIFQFVIVFPIIYVIYKKNPNLMLIISFIINLVFEFIAFSFSIFQNNSYIYSACILRYLFVISLGLWMVENLNYEKKFLDKKKIFIFISLIFSSIYLLLSSNFSFKFPYFIPDWGYQNLLASFYTLFLFLIGMKFLPSKSKNKILKFLALIGKASYHIFLIQIIIFGAGFTFSIVINLSVISYSMYLTLFLAIITNMSICLISGLLFYFSEQKLVKKIF